MKKETEQKTEINVLPDGCMTFAEYGKAIGRSHVTLNRWSKKGYIVTYKIGNICLVDVDATNKKLLGYYDT